MIIGANGFLGSSLVNELQRDKSNKLTLFCRMKCLLNTDSATEIIDDLRNIQNYKEELANQDFIFFMAGLSGAALSNENGAEFIEGNEIYLLCLLDQLKKLTHPPAIIFPSSRLVYKSSHNPVEESGEISPNSIYALCKLHSENLLSLYQKLYNIPFLVLRISIPFGFTNVLHNGYGIVNHFIQTSLSGGTIELFGDGNQKRDVIYIHDLNAIFNYCINYFEKVKNRIFNCGGNRVYSIAEIAYKVLENFQSGSVQHVEWPAEYKIVETGDVTLNSDCLYNALNFRPQYDLEDALLQIKRFL